MADNIFIESAGFDPRINVTQFGWDENDKAGVDLIIDYVAQVKKLRDECVAIYIQLKDVIDGLPNIENYYNYIKGAYEDFRAKYPAFERDYQEFLTKYAEITLIYADIKTLHTEFQAGKDFINQALVVIGDYIKQLEEARLDIDKKWAEIGVMHTEVKGYRDECESFAEEVRNGKVYRGTWDPEAKSAYPSTPATNSIWDIVLASGKSEFSWNSITWKAGNSLVYVKVDNKWEQVVNAASGVVSFKGRTGVVQPEAGDYTAVMVGADPAGTADTTCGSAISDLKAEADPFPKYPLKTEIPTLVVTSFNGQKGDVKGEGVWTVVEMKIPAPSIDSLEGRVMLLADTRDGAMEINLNDNITELLIKDVTGACKENPLKIIPTANFTINGNDSESLDKNFGYVHYLKVGSFFITVGGM